MDIAKLLSAKEGENIEFKEAKTDFDFEKLTNFVPSARSYRGNFK